MNPTTREEGEEVMETYPTAAEHQRLLSERAEDLATVEAWRRRVEGVRGWLASDRAKQICADALFAGRPNNRDRDGKFGEGAITSNRAIAETGAERIIADLLKFFDAEYPRAEEEGH